MTRTLRSFAVVCIGLLAACGSQESVPRPSQPRVRVAAQLETVQALSVPEIYEAVGTIRSSTTTTLASRIMGSITAIHVKEGTRVASGQVLIEIDARDVKARLLQARAGLEQARHSLEEARRGIGTAEAALSAADANAVLAESTLHRFEGLIERNSVSRQEFDEVKARYQAAVAERARAEEMLEAQRSRKRQAEAQIEGAAGAVEEAEIRLDWTELRAPMAGLVIGKHAERGDLAAPGLPLLTIEDPRAYRLEATINESALSLVAPDQPVTVRIDAIEEEIVGEVSEILPSASPSTRSFLIKITLPRHPFVRSGMYGTARFPLGERTTYTVPVTAIAQRGQLTGVYVVDQTDTAHFQLVKTGQRYGSRIEILSGLQEGQIYLAAPDSRVEDGVGIDGQSAQTPGETHE